MSGFTPGPWRWELNLKHKQVQLCGGVPRFDLTVMGFQRWGMSGATPTFLRDRAGMLLISPAHSFEVNVPGREHHASWFQGLDHPDARLIAAAPDQNAALKRALVPPVGFMEYSRDLQLAWLCDYMDWWREVCGPALAKAEGQP